MPERPPFYPAQARELAEAFNAHGVDYMFIGKSGAILLGFPGTTQAVDVYPARSQENGRRIIDALTQLGFTLDDTLKAEIVNDFTRLRRETISLF